MSDKEQHPKWEGVDSSTTENALESFLCCGAARTEIQVLRVPQPVLRVPLVPATEGVSWGMRVTTFCHGSLTKTEAVFYVTEPNTDFRQRPEWLPLWMALLLFREEGEAARGAAAKFLGRKMANDTKK